VGHYTTTHHLTLNSKDFLIGHEPINEV